jgi:hypothetical protein
MNSISRPLLNELASSDWRYQDSAHGKPAANADHGHSRDRSGFAVFSDGDMGTMHVIAHEAFDNGEVVRGHRVLGRWLASHSGSGSDWVHLQFHMAVFELALGDWHAAYARYRTEIRPIAETSQTALTDAPSLLWRLEIAAPALVTLPWQSLRATAAAAIEQETDPFIVLHQLLVFAGAGDNAAIARWQREQRNRTDAIHHRVLRQVADALASIARCDYAAAARSLRQAAPKLPLIGGSLAQNDLYRQLEQWCLQQVPEAGALPVVRLAD